MAQPGSSPADVITQLEAARKLVLQDAHVYLQILPGIQPLVNSAAHLEVRRWGMEFFAEGFASPALSNKMKEDLSAAVLPTLRGMLDVPGEDAEVVKSAIQAAASLYPHVFRRIVSHPEQVSLWQDMNAIKLNILSRMDTAPTNVKICCIKFIQKVVQVQTPGLIADPRRPDQNETSIALVPRTHPLLSLPQLEAEASGLLDRLLSIFQENPNDPIMIDATMNCVAVLIRTRQAVANKILAAILNFNPMKQANSPMTSRLRVIVRSLERTTRALLRNVMKTNPNGPLSAKIDAYLVRLNQSRSSIFSDAPSLKRSAPTEATDGPDDAKRQKLMWPNRYPPLPPPPNSFAQLYTLTDNTALQQFDVKVLPTDMVNTIAGLLLQYVDGRALDEAINAVRGRYAHLQKVARPTPVPLVPMAGPTGIDDEDDYDPEYDPGNDIPIAAASDKILEELAQPAIELGPFELPKPSPLTGAEVSLLSQQTVSRVFEIVASLEVPAQASTRQKLGLNRLAASTNDRDAWATVMTRLATRAPVGLDDIIDYEDGLPGVKPEPQELDVDKPSLANGIRQTLYMYVLEDWRSRLNMAISWLNEEWYSDKTQAESDSAFEGLPNYTHWTHRILDALLPYLDARDNKLLVRFLSEIPAIDLPILEKVKSLARDPERVNMCMMALQYLILMRPPVKTMAIDIVEAIWRDEDFREARATATKILAKQRPGVLEAASEVFKNGEDSGESKTGEANGVNALRGVKSASPALKTEEFNARKQKNTNTQAFSGVSLHSAGNRTFVRWIARKKALQEGERDAGGATKSRPKPVYDCEI